MFGSVQPAPNTLLPSATIGKASNVCHGTKSAQDLSRMKIERCVKPTRLQKFEVRNSTCRVRNPGLTKVDRTSRSPSFLPDPSDYTSKGMPQLRRSDANILSLQRKMPPARGCPSFLPRAGPRRDADQGLERRSSPTLSRHSRAKPSTVPAWIQRGVSAVPALAGNLRGGTYCPAAFLSKDRTAFLRKQVGV